MNRDSLWYALWRQNRIVPVILLVLLLANLGLYLVTAYGIAPEASRLEQQFLRQQEDLRQVESLGRQKDTPEAIYRQGKQDLAAFFAAIPAREDLTTLIGEIFSLARGAGLAIERVSYDPEKLKGSPLLSYTLVFSVTGNYEQLKKYVFSLEQSPRIFTLDEISFSASDAAARTVTLNLRFTTYFQAERA